MRDVSDIYHKFVNRLIVGACCAVLKFVEKITPVFPYDNYKTGGIYVNPKGRKLISLYSSHIDKLMREYARYLVEVKEQRLLGPDEEVDHVDNDCTNDDVDNLQILSNSDHRYKTDAFKGTLNVVMFCPICKQKFIRRYTWTHLRHDDWVMSMCSIECNSKYRQILISSDITKWVRQHQVLYIIRIRDFEYREFLGDLYPHCEILTFGSREMIDENGMCKDIPGLTEYCWNFVTPLEDQISFIRNCLENGMTQLDIMNLLHIANVSSFINEHIPEFSRVYRQEKTIDIIRELPDGYYTSSEIGEMVNMYGSNLVGFLRRNAPELLVKVRGAIRRDL